MNRRQSLLFVALPALTALAAAGAAGVAQAQPALPAELVAELPAARLQGSASLRFMGLRIYDARLWSNVRLDASGWAAQAFALELVYARGLVGKKIAERSLAEMRRHGDISAPQAQTWLARMEALFPDVAAGDRLTAVLRPGQSAHFFHNGKALAEVVDADFARLFFAIWLGPATSEPGMRKQLMGLAP
jgi:Chalcone isomerase-like